MIEVDAVIIGGGIVGASAALFLSQAGRRVALLERDFCGSHSSGVNYGGVRRQGRPLSQLPLSQRAHEIWCQLPQLIGIDGEYQRSGHLKLARSAEDLQALHDYAVASQGFGLDLQLLDHTALRARFPWVGAVAVGASLCPDDGHANPRLVSPAFAQAARRQGAQVHEQCAVSNVVHDGQRFAVHTATGLTFHAPWLLNCAGAWASQFAAQFGEAVPMHAGHPAMLVTEPLPLVMDASTGVEGAVSTPARSRAVIACWAAAKALHWTPLAPGPARTPCWRSCARPSSSTHSWKAPRRFVPGAAPKVTCPIANR